jgi:hypothetical protein
MMNLDEAYKRARPAFIGRLERTFVVLKDEREEVDDKLTGSNMEPLGKGME